jgi:hypothetical protein
MYAPVQSDLCGRSFSSTGTNRACRELWSSLGIEYASRSHSTYDLGEASRTYDGGRFSDKVRLMISARSTYDLGEVYL